MALKTPLLAACLVLVAGTATAEIPDEFKNLEIFPKDIGKRELVGAMRDFASALGVRCHHCHEMKTPGDFDSIDWASEAKPEKKKARGMMRMVGRLNNELLPEALGENDQKVSCVTCHRGLTDPRTLDLVLLATIDKDGAHAGAEQYKELRDQYYGSGSYDFGPQVLLDVASTLAQTRGDTGGAMELLELNARFNPDHSYTYLTMAQIQMLTGDKDAAIAHAKKALELDPENRNAARVLEQLQGGTEGK